MLLNFNCFFDVLELNLLNNLIWILTEKGQSEREYKWGVKDTDTRSKERHLQKLYIVNSKVSCHVSVSYTHLDVYKRQYLCL